MLTLAAMMDIDVINSYGLKSCVISSNFSLGNDVNT